MVRRPIDYAGLAAALLDRAHVLVPQWLPAGTERAERWYCGDFDGGAGESANVNLRTGQWIDNGGSEDDRGGDLISLYARLHNLSNHDAAIALMDQMGWQRADDDSWRDRPRAAAPPASAGAAGSPPWDDGAPLPEPLPGAGAPGEPAAAVEGVPAAAGAPARAGKRQPTWTALPVVPAHAPRPSFRWRFEDKAALPPRWIELEPVRTWEYRWGGQCRGHVARFERVSSKTGEIVKDTLPHTWCQSTEDGLQRWHWKTWDAPRPLYVPAGELVDGLVVVVEGEKCAQAGADLGLDGVQWVSWPGGCKTWQYADWSWLAGRDVVLWPDADAEHERLTKAEREAGVDKSTKPLLPEARQPGWSAMQGIGTLLAAQHGCKVRMCRIPAPGAVSHGWDVADAIAQGWTAEQVRGMLDGARPLVLEDAAARTAEKNSARSIADAESDGEDLSWRRALLQTAKGVTLAVRDNVVTALEGAVLPSGKVLPGIPEAQGVIAFNEFTNQVEKLKPTPWGTRAGPWTEVDELEMGNWLTREHWLPSMGRQTLEEAVQMVAWRHKHHPVRDHFERLRGTWDGTQRLRLWLARCCRAEGLQQDGEDDADRMARLHELADGRVEVQASAHDGDALAAQQAAEDAARLGRYLARVGRWVIMAICARVMDPGCKFDYMLIFEGGQGLGKSTLARHMGWQWFADTGLVLGDKDSYQNLQGVLVYEWGELDALTKAEVTKVKQFISSACDRFRASFDRRPRDYPRQCVFVGTTNERHYLSDPTGNRRMWPLAVTRQIDLAWFLEHRDQLFAEALHYLDEGQRFHPSPAEQRELFDSAQGERAVENSLESAIRRYLYDEDQRVPHGGRNGATLNEVSLGDLLNALGISVDKQSGQITKQASAALTRLGWERGRSSPQLGENGQRIRPWVYRRPKGDPKPSAAALAAQRIADDESGLSASRSTATPATAVQELDDCPF
ncbi:MAG: hypothetical protein RIQ53_4203 [Pseudomonadota bacterium]|jgi:predicted P-loop ATPase